MKVRVFAGKHILVKPEETLKLNDTTMKILRKSQNQPNTSETILTNHFPVRCYCLSQLRITSEKQ